MMITLYTFGPFFGLPDGSPFVTKAMLLLKIAGLPFDENRDGYGMAPKGKLPYIDDDGERIADSTFIRLHIEKKYGFDFDAGLTAEQKAIAWALEKLCEDHLYWLIIVDRWLIEGNFVKGPAHFFNSLPAPLRPLIRAMVRRRDSLKRDSAGPVSPFARTKARPGAARAGLDFDAPRRKAFSVRRHAPRRRRDRRRLHDGRAVPAVR